MLKNLAAAACFTALLASTSPAKADAFSDCMKKAYMSDQEMTICNEDEVSRKLDTIDAIYKQILSKPYYKNWGYDNIPPLKNFEMMLSNWQNYSNTYCNLYGYSFTPGLGTIYRLQIAQCKLDLTSRLLEDIKAISKIYKDNNE